VIGIIRQIGSNALANILNGVAVGVFQVAMTALVTHFWGAKVIPVRSLAASGDVVGLALWGGLAAPLLDPGMHWTGNLSA
jgi:hypothetical protein